MAGMCRVCLLSLSPIDCVSWEARGSTCLPLPRCRPTGLMGMSVLLGPPTFRLAQHTSESSDLSYHSVIDSSAGPTQIDSPRPVPRWRLAREGPFLSEISSLNVAGFGHGCAFRSTTYRPSDYAQPSGKYGLPLHHPRFWSGSVHRSHLVCWIKVLVRGFTRLVSRPLTRPANFTVPNDNKL